MKSVMVHQLVHGYAKGHSLLASSCRLPKSAQETVIEQSDLSGPLPAGVTIPSYITAYPLPDTEFFALARTWPDTNAPRSGCVITHTLLIPTNVWGSTPFPHDFLQLHKCPDKSSLEYFKEEIHFPKNTDDQAELDWLTRSEAHQFASRVFSEGLRSVVWFECEHPDLVVMAFASLLWPSLRTNLYAHTFSLQPQAKIKSELQLHFVPRGAQSYFSRVPKQCQMIKGSVGNKKDSEQEWIDEISDDLRAGRPRESYRNGLQRYGHLLGGEPTAVRNLFALRELADRLPHTPMAAIGILDIIDSLEPLADRAVKDKQLALDMAVSASLKADAPSSLHCLSLVDARLRRSSFSKAGTDTSSALKDAVGQLVAKEPNTLIATCGQTIPVDESYFWEGVRDGIRTAAEVRPASIENLGRCPDIASFVIRGAPVVARAYLHSSPDRREESILQVVDWVHRIERTEERHLLREELLPEAHDDPSVPLLEELLRDLRNGDVPATLDTLANSTQGLSRASIRRVVSDFVCQRFPLESIQWGIGSRLLQSKFVADVVAESFAVSLEGLEQILSIDWMTPENRCEMWSAFVERAAKKQLPQWFVRRAAIDVTLIEPFSQCEMWSARTTRALEAIGEQCEYIPLVRSIDVSEFIQKLVRTGLSDRFIAKTVESAITEHIAGKVSDERMLDALKLPPCEKWCEQAPSSRIHDLLLTCPDRDAWRRAWGTLSVLPQPLFQKVAGHQIIAAFIRSYRASWIESVAEAWKHIVQRANEELPYENSLRLLMESTAFCLNNPRLPVGQVVCSAFPLVYDAVVTGRATQVTDEMFGYFDWDKAKKLRKDVIDAYVSSHWPPEELALIAARCQVLRKVVHRLQRKWGGDEYIRRMIEGLGSRNSAEAMTVRGELSAIVNDPNFFEPWD